MPPMLRPCVAPTKPPLTSKPMPATTPVHSHRKLRAGQLVRISLTGKITGFDVTDSCMQVESSSTGLFHYILDADPGCIILPVEASWPPKANDVWLIGGKVWHVTSGGFLAESLGGGTQFKTARRAETILHSADKPPEMLFRWSV